MNNWNQFSVIPIVKVLFVLKTCRCVNQPLTGFCKNGYSLLLVNNDSTVPYLIYKCQLDAPCDVISIAHLRLDL